MERPPVLPRAETHDREQHARTLGTIRRFHVGASSPDDAATRAPAELLPALLFPFRDPSRVRDEFPLFVAAAPTSSDPVCTPLPDLLTAALAARGGEARILTDNRKRIERIVRDLVAARGGRGQAAEVLGAAGTALREELALATDQDAQLTAQWRALCDGLPAGELFALDTGTPLRLLTAAARKIVPPRRAAFDIEVARLRDGLAALLEIDRRKDPNAHEPGALSSALGSAGSRLLDPQALSKVLGPHRGSRRLDDTRRARLTTALERLEKHLTAPQPPLVIAFCNQADPAVEPDDDLACLPADDPCADAARRFDLESERLTDVFRAVRVAGLELDEHYDSARHDPWLSALDWEGFSPDELLLVPRCVALESADALSGERLASLSQLLRSGRPVQVIAHVAPGSNPADPSVSSYRLELGYLGIGHREAFVQQSTSARPEHLARGFEVALERTRAGLHVVASGLAADGAPPRVGAWLHAGAAIEGRAHPLFRYDPEAGATWARRLDFSVNPAPEADWPDGELTYRDEEGAETQRTLHFTFADYALLEPSLRAEFRVVKDADDEALVPVDEFLDLDPGAAAHRIPFVWAIDHEGTLLRLAVTRRLVAACRDRLDFWRTLQELAGVRNEHVREAVARAREEAETRAREDRERLEAEHRAEIERVREAAFGEAMQGLASSLLELGPDALAQAAPRPAAAPRATAPAPEATEPEADAEPAPAPEPEPPASVAEEPWIDTPLCTSCNDCRNINPLLFVYDENKQARIGDPKAGTFAQLVQAAEKCPARCIHPGSPLDPSEPNLDELIARAAPFHG